MNLKLLIGGGVVLAILGAVLTSRKSSAGSAPPRGKGAELYPGLEKWRQDFLDCVYGHADAKTLYQWGGGHGHGDDYGLDCSGLVNVCAQAAGMHFGENADMMYHDLPRVSYPVPGDVALYGTQDHASHVRVVTAWFPDEERAECIGAEGGNRNTTTPQQAIDQGAYVRTVDDHRKFGAEFLGFYTLQPYGDAMGMPEAASLMPVAPSPPS